MTLPTGPDPTTPTVPLLTVDRFQELTGSTSEPTPEQLYSAQRAVEAYLGRGLAKIERTERCRVYRDRRVYPKCTPLVSVTDGYVIDGAAIYGAGIGVFDALGRPDMTVAPYASVTYTGGWDADELPQPIEDALAAETLARMSYGAGQVPAGATSITNGDVSVTFAAPQGGSGISPTTAAALAGWRVTSWEAR